MQIRDNRNLKKLEREKENLKYGISCIRVKCKEHSKKEEGETNKKGTRRVQIEKEDEDYEYG